MVSRQEHSRKKLIEHFATLKVITFLHLNRRDFNPYTCNSQWTGAYVMIWNEGTEQLYCNYETASNRRSDYKMSNLYIFIKKLNFCYCGNLLTQLHIVTSSLISSLIKNGYWSLVLVEISVIKSSYLYNDSLSKR